MDTITTISTPMLALSLLPIVLVLIVQQRWSNNYREGAYAVLRMLAQLALIGYFLVFVFTTDEPVVVLAVLAIMVLASAWIALRTVKDQRAALYPTALFSILIGGSSVLVLVTQGVLDLDPWYRPQYMIPLAGMIFAYSMNALSLAADRYFHEVGNGIDQTNARSAAYRAALIPVTNSFFAVGLVLIPGMMTGQILSGVDPLIAARYQIMVMAMVFGAGGLSSAVFLALVSKQT